MAGEGVGVHLVGGQVCHAVPFGARQPDGILAAFPDIGQPVSAAPPGVGLNAVGRNGGAFRFSGLGHDQILAGAVHHPVAGNVIAGGKQVEHAHHRDTGRGHGNQLFQSCAVQLYQAGGAGGGQQAEHAVGGTVVIEGTQDHGKVCSQPAQQQDHRPGKRRTARFLQPQQQIQRGKRQQQRQGVVPQHIQAVKKPYRVLGQERRSIHKIIGAVVIARRGDQDGKPRQRAGQPGEHTGGDLLFLPQQKRHAEHQADQQPGAGVFAQPAGKKTGHGHACRHGAPGGKRLLQVIPPGQQKHQAAQRRPQIIAGAAHPQIGLAESRADLPQGSLDQYKGRQIIPAAAPPQGQAIDHQPQPQIGGGVAQVEHDFGQHGKALGKKLYHDPAGPFHVVVRQALDQLRQAGQAQAGVKGIGKREVIGDVGRQAVEQKHQCEHRAGQQKKGGAAVFCGIGHGEKSS